MASSASPAPPRRSRRVTLSPIGRSTPGVTLANDGADHGPDDPGTSTNGVQEFLNHHVSDNVTGEWWPGLYVVAEPVVVPYHQGGFHWVGPGRDAIRVVPGPGCVGKDMISVAGPGVMVDVRVEGLTFGTRGMAVRHLVNFSNPSGPEAETSTRWVLRDCRFQGVGHTGFTLVMDYNEDSAIDDSFFLDGPGATPGPTTGNLSWIVPRGAGAIRNTVFAHGQNPTYALVHSLSFAFRDSVLPMQLELLSGPGATREIHLDHSWQQRSIPGRSNVVNSSGFPLSAHVSSSWMYGFGRQPIFGGQSRWNLILDQSNFIGDGSAIPLVEDRRGSTVRGRNPVFANGVIPPPLAGA